MKARPQCNFSKGNNLPAQTGNDYIWKYFLKGPSHILTAKSFRRVYWILSKVTIWEWMEFKLKSLIHYLRDFNVVRDPKAHPSIRVLDKSYVIVFWSNRLCTHEVSGRRDKAKQQSNVEIRGCLLAKQITIFKHEMLRNRQIELQVCLFQNNWRHWRNLSSGEEWTGTKQNYNGLPEVGYQ